VERKRVRIWKFPLRRRGSAIGWKDHYYGRSGKSLSALSYGETDEIREQTRTSDWSAHWL